MKNNVAETSSGVCQSFSIQIPASIIHVRSFTCSTLWAELFIFLLFPSDSMAYGTNSQYGSKLSHPLFWFFMWCGLQLHKVTLKLSPESHSMDNNYSCNLATRLQSSNLVNGGKGDFKVLALLQQSLCWIWNNSLSYEGGCQKMNSDSCNSAAIKKIAPMI